MNELKSFVTESKKMDERKCVKTFEMVKLFQLTISKQLMCIKYEDFYKLDTDVSGIKKKFTIIKEITTVSDYM